VGSDVHVHRSVIFFGGPIRIASRVRIDALSLLSGDIEIGSNVHIASGAKLFGGSGGIVLEDFVGVSSNSIIYTATDDYVDGFLTGPTIPEQFKNLRSGPVRLGRHVVVGAGSVVLPGLTIGFGSTVGANSLVSRSIPDGLVMAGSPLRQVKTRNLERLRRLETEYLATLKAT
jgi:galactoside O-acetyltransferase